MQQDVITRSVNKIRIQSSTILNVIKVYKVLHPEYAKAVEDILVMIDEPINDIKESTTDIVVHCLDQEHCEQLEPDDEED